MTNVRTQSRFRNRTDFRFCVVSTCPKNRKPFETEKIWQKTALAVKTNFKIWIFDHRRFPFSFISRVFNFRSFPLATSRNAFAFWIFCKKPISQFFYSYQPLSVEKCILTNGASHLPSISSSLKTKKNRQNFSKLSQKLLPIVGFRSFFVG